MRCLDMWGGVNVGVNGRDGMGWDAMQVPCVCWIEVVW
jgi:hypothetical protein